MKDSFVDGIYLYRKYGSANLDYRYYPTASQFQTAFSKSQHLLSIELSNSMMLPKDLALCIHLPFCSSSGCLSEYFDALNREITLISQLINEDRLVRRIHVYATTPDLDIDQIVNTLDQIESCFNTGTAEILETSIVLDPDSVTKQQIYQLLEIGFTRFSLPVAASNLTSDIKCIFATISALRGLNAHISIELIVGLPGQMVNSIESTLGRIVATGAAHILLHDLGRREPYHYVRTVVRKRVLLETRFAILQLARNILTSSGYYHLGRDLFALPDDALSIALLDDCLQLNALGYAPKNDLDVIGLGVAAISTFDTAYAQNECTLRRYMQRISNDDLPIEKGVELTDDDRLRAEVIGQIMCRRSVNLSQKTSMYLDHESQLTLRGYFKPEITKLTEHVNDGLIVHTDNGFDITDSGRYFVGAIASEFDCYRTQTDQADNVIPLTGRTSGKIPGKT